LALLVSILAHGGAAHVVLVSRPHERQAAGAGSPRGGALLCAARVGLACERPRLAVLLSRYAVWRLGSASAEYQPLEALTTN